MEHKLVKKIQITGRIKAITGLHIGGSNLGVGIGGVDASVIRNPYTNEPYIPGSSLKGKMRTLIERLEGKFGSLQDKNVKKSPYRTIVDKNHSDFKYNYIPEIFGFTPEDNLSKELPTSRLIVRDCRLNKISREKLAASKTTDMPYTEIKTEVVIDRVTSRATPRQLERVPAGAIFRLKLILNVFEGDNEKNLLDKIFMGLILLQNDYLGGKGTRGSGEVQIKLSAVKQKTIAEYEKNEVWKDYLDKSNFPDELS